MRNTVLVLPSEFPISLASLQNPVAMMRMLSYDGDGRHGSDEPLPTDEEFEMGRPSAKKLVVIAKLNLCA